MPIRWVKGSKVEVVTLGDIPSVANDPRIHAPIRNVSIAELRTIGWNIWDPLSLLALARESEIDDEYDDYLIHAVKMLISEGDKPGAVKYLLDAERITMGQPPRTISPSRASKTIDHISDLILRKTVDLGGVSLSSILLPVSKGAEGALVRANSMAWLAAVQELRLNWNKAHTIPPNKWEEIIAAAFDKEGFDEVILTPRSGDRGRDVIAIRKGIGCIKIIGSVKAYKPGHLVDYNDIRALLGVMSGEQNASKGMLITTSGFPPNINKDPFIFPFLPTRLELLDGMQVQRWLERLSKK